MASNTVPVNLTPAQINDLLEGLIPDSLVEGLQYTPEVGVAFDYLPDPESVEWVGPNVVIDNERDSTYLSDAAANPLLILWVEADGKVGGTQDASPFLYREHVA